MIITYSPIEKKRILSALGIWKDIDRYEAIRPRQMATRQFHLQLLRGDSPSLAIRSAVVFGIGMKCSVSLFYRGRRFTK
ncbi:hypothetical protein CGRA01v4_13920 [Colletotrichum graminicola]|nr:hypothetical protein CGRA01v4_13920 [Colletotrichum graminicola]